MTDIFEDIFNRLVRGDFASGWPMHEQRWEAESMAAAKAQLVQRNFQVPLWLGQAALLGKTIFIWPEQGHGDVFQFSRYVNNLAAVGAKVLLAAHTATIRLLTQSYTHPNITVVLDLEEHTYQFDYHCPVMSLPLACGTDSVEKIPAPIPYLFAATQDALDWQQKIDAIRPLAKRRVGIVWAGGQRPKQPELALVDAARSLQLAQFEPLFKLAQTFDAGAIQIFSLQLGEPAKQLEHLQDLPLINLTPGLKDWADTAALIANLDLVISCDTAVAHLAAAMGKPTWILSRFNGCWRWLAGRDDSPWYPTVRLFRQKTRGDWETVMAEVAAALASYNG